MEAPEIDLSGGKYGNSGLSEAEDSTRNSLLVTESFDWVQIRRLNCGDHAADHSNQHQDNCRNHNAVGGDEQMNVRGIGVRGDCTVERDAAYRLADGIGQRDASSSPDARDDHGFGKKLHQDVPLSRAESLLYTDLACALLHADQHDVHQADACDTQRQRTDE